MLAYGLGPISGRVISFLVAVFVTWSINRNWAFREHRTPHKGKELLRYLVAQSGGLTVNFSLYVLLVRTTAIGQHYPVVAVTISALVALMVNYLSLHLFVFKTPNSAPK